MEPKHLIPLGLGVGVLVAALVANSRNNGGGNTPAVVTLNPPIPDPALEESVRQSGENQRTKIATLGTVAAGALDYLKTRDMISGETRVARLAAARDLGVAQIQGDASVRNTATQAAVEARRIVTGAFTDMANTVNETAGNVATARYRFLTDTSLSRDDVVKTGIQAGRDVSVAGIGAQRDVSVAGINAQRDTSVAHYGAWRDVTVSTNETNRDISVAGIGADRDVSIAGIGANRDVAVSTHETERERIRADAQRHAVSTSASAQRAMAEQDRKQARETSIINGVSSVAGTVIGGLLGGPVGAGVGGTIAGPVVNFFKKLF